LNSWTHTDQAYCTYAFALCSDRQVLDPSIQPFSGSSFVDVGLKVIVRQAIGTMMVFKPENLHATTLAHGAVNCFLLVSFSRRVYDAWKEALELGNKVEIIARDGAVEET
jgi:hypothetical protein